MSEDNTQSDAEQAEREQREAAEREEADRQQAQAQENAVTGEGREGEEGSEGPPPGTGYKPGEYPESGIFGYKSDTPEDPAPEEPEAD